MITHSSLQVFKTWNYRKQFLHVFELPLRLFLFFHFLLIVPGCVFFEHRHWLDLNIVSYDMMHDQLVAEVVQKYGVRIMRGLSHRSPANRGRVIVGDVQKMYAPQAETLAMTLLGMLCWQNVYPQLSPR